MEVYDNIFDLGKRIIWMWKEKGRGSLENFITSRWGRAFNLYCNELNQPGKPKKVKKENIWAAMQREDGLQKEITKAMLKHG